MLTRSQVARRLGKSIATVRRLEGTTFHPSRDRNGVYRFEEDEVNAFACDRQRATPASRWHDQVGRADDAAACETTGEEAGSGCEDVRRLVVVLKKRLDAAEARFAEVSERANELPEDDESREENLMDVLAAWFDSRSSRELKHLALGGMDELLQMLAELR